MSFSGAAISLALLPAVAGVLSGAAKYSLGARGGDAVGGVGVGEEGRQKKRDNVDDDRDKRSERSSGRNAFLEGGKAFPWEHGGVTCVYGTAKRSKAAGGRRSKVQL